MIIDGNYNEVIKILEGLKNISDKYSNDIKEIFTKHYDNKYDYFNKLSNDEVIEELKKIDTKYKNQHPLALKIHSPDSNKTIKVKIVTNNPESLISPFEEAFINIFSSKKK